MHAMPPALMEASLFSVRTGLGTSYLWIILCMCFVDYDRRRRYAAESTSQYVASIASVSPVRDFLWFENSFLGSRHIETLLHVHPLACSI